MGKFKPGPTHPNFKHGKSQTKAFRTWSTIQSRCKSQEIAKKSVYADRGILVCNEWLESFENFYRDMGDPPTSNHSIDRIDNNKGYSKENCRWATTKEQALNRRTVKMITHNGVTMCESDWSKKLFGSSSTLSKRIRKYKMSLQEAFDKPNGFKNKLITFNGETKTQNAWSIELFDSTTVLYQRLKKGMSIQEAMTKPLNLSKSSKYRNNG